MAKKLLSPELSVVIKDIDNTREAINEKYALNGFPEPIPAPLLSGDMAEAVRKIQTVNELPELDGTVELSVDHKTEELSGGYYKNGIHAKLKDYVVGYVWNRQDMEAKRQHVNIGEDFTIPDFLNGESTVPEVPNEEFLGWSSNWKAKEPHYLPGMVVSNFEFERHLQSPEYVAYLYAVWRKLYLYTLTYSPNGGTGAPPKESYGYTADEAHNFVLNTSVIPVRETHRFLGWGDTPESTVVITNKTVTYLNPDAVVYALWELMALDDITLEFTYAHPENDYGIIINDSTPETVTMTVRGQDPSYPNLQRNFTASGYNTVDTDVEKGAIFYKHKFTFTKVGIYPVLVSHEAPSVDSKVANGVMKVMYTGGTMGGPGKFDGDRFDTGWISEELMPGCTIKSYKFDLQVIASHFATADQMYVLIKKTNGEIVRIRDTFNTDWDGTNANNPVKEVYTNSMNYVYETGNTYQPQITIEDTYSDKVGNLSGKKWSLHGTLSKSDDARQIRFIAITYAHAGCATGANIDYNMDYDWDYGLYTQEIGKGPSPNPTTPGGGPSTPTTPINPTDVIDVQLDSLVISPGSLSPAFSSGTHTYTLTISKQTNEVNASYVVKDPRTTITISDNNKNPISVRDANGKVKKKINIVVDGDGSASTTGNGNYVINIVEEKSSNNNLSDLSVNQGTLTPSFNKATTSYEMTVENNISDLQFTWTTEDSSASSKCSKANGKINLSVGMNVLAITVTAEDGSSKIYTVTITRKAASSVNPGNPDMPAQRETATVLLPTPKVNFSEILDGSCITSKYGYWELSKQSSTKCKKLREAYVRIYNMFLNNGEKINGAYEYSITQLDGTVKSNIPMFINIVESNGSYNLVSGSITGAPTSNPKRYNMTYKVLSDSSRTWLSVYLFDLELTIEETKYVYGLVMEDCPELMFKFQSSYIPFPGYKQMSVVNNQLTPSSSDTPYGFVVATRMYFNESMRRTMMQTCVDTLNEINKLVDDTYGIKFKNSDFATNNQTYSSSDMVKIGKVIHDYLEAYNVYGREGGHYINQTMYPALSRGKWNPVCASYARAFQYCCWRWGINACYVSGYCDADLDGVPEPSAGHAWSIVSYQNKPVSDIAANSAYWQEVDCTWDDTGKPSNRDYGARDCKTSDFTVDLPELISNTNKTTGWDDATTCGWAYFNLTTTDINANKPNVAGTSGGAGCRARDTSYKYLVKGTCKKYTYNGTTLYGGFETIT